MALSANRELERFVDQQVREFPVAAGVNIFKGALLMVSDVAGSVGMAAPLVAGKTFAGVAFEAADNTGGAAGAIKVRVITQGDIVHPLASVAQSDAGKKTYASDDGTMTFTATANSFVGFCLGVEGSDAIVRLSPLNLGA